MNDRSVQSSVRYCGIIPPVVTPVNEDGSLDVPGLEKLIEHLICGNVSGLFILGTTGEAPSLGETVQNELIKRTCHQADGRSPVLVGITNTCFETSVKTALTAQRNGADAVVLSTPYYFCLSQQDLAAYTKKLLEKIDLPVFLYNIPSCTKVWFELSTLRELMNCPRIIGLKDSSADMIYLQQAYQLAVRHRPDWSILIGPEELLAEAVLMGINGGVSGGANLFPQLYVELYQAALARRMDRIQILQNIVLQISRTIYAVEKGGASYLKGLKCAMGCLGICSELPAQPVQPLPQHLKDQIRQNLETNILPALKQALPGSAAGRAILPVGIETDTRERRKVSSSKH